MVRDIGEQHIEDLRKKIRDLEEELRTWRDILQSYEDIWLAKRDNSGGQKTLPRKNNKRPSDRSLFLRVVREADGELLHIKEIWKRAKALGAASKAKRPEGAVDLSLLGLKDEGKPIERIKPSQWRWTGD